MSPLRALLLLLASAYVEGRTTETNTPENADIRTSVLPSIGDGTTSQVRELYNSTKYPLENYIVGGTPAVLGQFPYQVQLQIENDNSVYLCGGTIIREDYILTAAHCLAIDSIRSVTVYAGSITRNSGTKRSANKLISHENYGGTTNDPHDIALIRLSSNLTYNENIKAIDLQNSTVASGTLCKISGWGTTYSGSVTPSNTLLYAEVPFIPTKECVPTPQDSVQDGQVCAGYQQGGVDSCQGDSGGPMVCNDMVTGVVSWGDGCAKPNRPGVYADVHYYKKWIEANMEPNGCSSILSLPLNYLLLSFLLVTTNVYTSV